jgi:hypothetical protein
MTNKILKKIIVLFSILPRCNVIISNPSRNIIIFFIPLEFSIALKIYKK